MLPEKPATEPRRKWHLLRWAFVVFVVVFGWGGWRHYDFRQAVKEAKERGWTFYYNDPAPTIRRNWKAAFEIKTWRDAGRRLLIPNDSPLERDFDLVRRLKPNRLSIWSGSPSRDLSPIEGLSNLTLLEFMDCRNLASIDALKGMKGLTEVAIIGSTVLANIDALKELQNLKRLELNRSTALENLDALRKLQSLESLSLYGCTGLKNVEPLHGLTGLRYLNLKGCTGLTKEAVDAVKAALPKTEFISDYKK